MCYFFSEGNIQFISRAGTETRKLRRVKPLRTEAEHLIITRCWRDKNWGSDSRMRKCPHKYLKVKVRVGVKIRDRDRGKAEINHHHKN